MTDELERAQATGALLLRALWRDPMTKHFVVTADKSKHFFHHPIAEVDTVDDFARPHVKDSHDCYFACAEFKTHDSRKGDNAVGAWGFWMDIDCGPDKAAAGKGYGSPDEAQRALADFCLRLELPGPTHVVSSGGGLHVYWTLDARLDAHDWKRHAGQLRDLHRSLNLLADGTRTADIASLLRLPGTFNQKSAPPRPVVLLHSAAPLSRDHMVAAIESAHVKSLPSAKTSESIGGESSPERSGLPVPLDRLKQVLADLDADCIYDDWVRILMAIHNETDGSQAGLDLAIKWSSGGIKYKGPLSIQQKWLGFDSNPSRSIGMGTLVHLSKQQNDFQPVPMEIVEPVPARPPSVAINPLARYSLRGQADSLERNMVNQVAILGRIALRGQATVLYAAPGTGKTFLTIHLLCDAIERGVLEPEKLFYLNMDDNSNGLITKVRIAELHGFHMLAPGHKNFEAKLFASKLKEMTDGDTAKGVVVILDTLKKFTNLMDKGSSSEFGSLVRNFVMKGGSVIALAHTNKNPGADGKPIHAGTSDIVEDFDCA